MSEKIRWGIIGCGDVTEVKSGPAFSKVKDSGLVAVMRRDAAKAADYARRHQVDRWYDDAGKLINDPEVNAVYVATPPSSHEQYTLAALSAGKPVYVEKPMADSFAAASNMARCARDNKMKLVVAHYRRQQPRFKMARQLINEQAIGRPLLVNLELTKAPLTPAELADPMIAWRVDPSIAGGGLFNDLAPHQLDLLYYFFGPVESVKGVATNQGEAYVADDMVAGNILFKSGVVFSGSWCFNASEENRADRVKIIGTRGSIEFTVFSEHTLTLVQGGKTTVLEFDPLPHVQQPMIEATVQHLLHDAPSPCSGEEGAEIMRLIEAFVAR